jgi:hypothetical protein
MPVTQFLRQPIVLFCFPLCFCFCFCLSTTVRNTHHSVGIFRSENKLSFFLSFFVVRITTTAKKKTNQPTNQLTDILKWYWKDETTRSTYNVAFCGLFQLWVACMHLQLPFGFWWHFTFRLTSWIAIFCHTVENAEKIIKIEAF